MELAMEVEQKTGLPVVFCKLRIEVGRQCGTSRIRLGGVQMLPFCVSHVTF